MNMLSTIEYFALFPRIPFWKWGKWRRRRQCLNSRSPVELSEWTLRVAPGKDWDGKLCAALLMEIGKALVVDPRRIRLSDHLGTELRMPTTILHENRCGEIGFFVRALMEHRRCIDSFPPPNFVFQEATIEQIFDFLHDIWAKFPKRIDCFSGYLIEPETDPRRTGWLKWKKL